MSYRETRERTIAQLMAAGWNWTDADKLHARANTAHRLAEAVCNGDYPADNGERKTAECPQCRGGWAPESLKRGGSVGQRRTWAAERKRLQADPETDTRSGMGPYRAEKVARLQTLNGLLSDRICPDCRNELRIAELLPDGWTFATAGDPRGCCLYVAGPGVDVRDCNERRRIGIAAGRS